VTGIVADARRIPLDDGCFDVITSQYGVEYAGPEALDEAARLLAPGGSLVMLMHIRPGVVFNECKASLDAVRRVQKAEFVERTLRFFEAGFAAVRGADRAPYDRAGQQLDPALRKIESVLSDYGDDVAGGVIARLYADVERIHTRIQFHDPDEVIGWLRTMGGELDAYASRMASMCAAASDRKSFRQMFRRLEKRGLAILEAEPLLPRGERLAIAWQLRAARPG
jgi:SAM-dependent methyltransferase